MQRLALLLALLIAAFLLGRATAPASAPRPARAARSERAAPAIPVPVRARPRDAAIDPVPPGGSSTPAADLADAKHAVPSEAPSVSAPAEDHGFLEIRNPEEVSEYELWGRDLRGKWVEWEYEPDDDTGPLRIELRTGSYRLIASRETELGPRIYRINIKPNANVVVDFSAAPTPDLFPLEPGLGRLDVEVTDTMGNPLPEIEVSLSNGGNRLEDVTGPAGRIRFDVIPGRYRIAAGALGQTVTVQAGRTQVLQLDGRSTGEIVLEGIMYRHAAIHALDRADADMQAFGENRSVRYVLLEPGRYEVACYILPQKRVRLNTVVVAAGRRVRIEPKPPGVFVRFRFPYPGGAMHRAGVRIESMSGEVIPFTSMSQHAVLFQRGRYTAVVDDKNLVSNPVAFEVVSAEVVVTIPVRRRPQPSK